MSAAKLPSFLDPVCSIFGLKPAAKPNLRDDKSGSNLIWAIMDKFFFFAALVSVFAVLLSLLAGILVMAKEGQENRIKSNKMMRLRVFLQAIALIFLLLAALTHR